MNPLGDPRETLQRAIDQLKEEVGILDQDIKTKQDKISALERENDDHNRRAGLYRKRASDLDEINDGIRQKRLDEARKRLRECQGY